MGSESQGPGLCPVLASHSSPSCPEDPGGKKLSQRSSKEGASQRGLGALRPHLALSLPFCSLALETMVESSSSKKSPGIMLTQVRWEGGSPPPSHSHTSLHNCPRSKEAVGMRCKIQDHGPSKT